MSKRVQRRRGTTLEHASFAGAVAEITIDTDKDTAVIHDGVAVGGFPLLREDFSNIPPAEAVPGSATWAALGLGDAAERTVGSLTGNLVAFETFGNAAWLNDGTLAGDLLKFDADKTLPTLNGANLVDLPQTPENTTNYINSNMLHLKFMQQNNLDVQVLADGVVDNFETEAGVNTLNSTGQIFDVGGDFYSNNDPAAIMTLESQMFAAGPNPHNVIVDPTGNIVPNPIAANGPRLVTITLLHEAIDALIPGDLIVEISRDGGTTWSGADYITGNGEMIPRGAFDFPPSPRGIMFKVVDLSTQPAGTSIKWKITTTANARQRIHGIALNWR